MTPSPKIKSLSQARIDRAHKRLQRRLEVAQKALEYTGDLIKFQCLQFEAFDDYLNEVPELRELREKVKDEFKLTAAMAIGNFEDFDKPS